MRHTLAGFFPWLIHVELFSSTLFSSHVVLGLTTFRFLSGCHVRATIQQTLMGYLVIDIWLPVFFETFRWTINMNIIESTFVTSVGLFFSHEPQHASWHCNTIMEIVIGQIECNDVWNCPHIILLILFLLFSLLASSFYTPDGSAICRSWPT